MIQTAMEPELTQAVRIVLKYEIQSLLSRLSDTGEEYIVLMASTDDRTCGHIGSTKGEGFVKNSSLETVKEDFLNFCTGNKLLSGGRSQLLTPQTNIPSPPTNTPVTTGSTPANTNGTTSPVNKTPAQFSTPIAASTSTKQQSKPHRRKSTPRCKLLQPTPDVSSSMEDDSVYMDESGFSSSMMDGKAEPSGALDLSEKSTSYAYTINDTAEDDSKAEDEEKEVDKYAAGSGYDRNRSYSNGLVGGTMPGFVFEKSALETASGYTDSSPIQSEYISAEPKKFHNEWTEEKIDINQYVKNELEKQEVIQADGNFGMGLSDSMNVSMAEQLTSAVAAAFNQERSFMPKSGGSFRAGSRRKSRKAPIKIERKSTALSASSVDLNTPLLPIIPSTSVNMSINNNNDVSADDSLLNRGVVVTGKKPGNSLVSISTTAKNQRGRKSSLDILDMKSAFEEIGNMAKCLICNKILANKNNRTFHWRSHVGDKRYECDICHKAFTHPSNMRSHRKIHTDEKPFPCDLCDRRFRRRDYLLQHLERFHYNPKSSSHTPVEGNAENNNSPVFGSESNSN